MKRQQGFTLIEMLIVVVLLAITVGMTSDMLMSLVRSNTKTQVLNEIEQQANFVSLKIEKELRDAIEVNSTLTGNTTLVFTRRNGDKVTYNLYDSGGNPAYLRRSVESGGISGPYFAVTSNVSPGGVSVSCPNGPCFEIVGTNPEVVKINMLFRQAQSETGVSFSGSAKIESSIVIRSTY